MEPNFTGRHVIGVDIGGTNSRAAVYTREGEKLGEARNPTMAEQGPETVIQQISRTILEAVTDSGVSKDSIAGVGCGMPGRIDSEGVILWSPNFPDIEGTPLVDRIANETGLAIWMENDANIASLGESRFGAGRGARSIVMFTLGTGIGGGIVLDGQVLAGFNGGGAEIGHMVVNPGGRKCGCGNHGCLEAMAGRDAIIERAVKKIQAGMLSPMAESKAVDFQADKITPALIAEYAEAGDAVCVETMLETGRWVGIGVANMINILNPEMVIIGGGISQAGEILWSPLLRTVKAHAIFESREACRIVPAQLGDDAGIMGGVTLALSKLEKA